MQSRVFETVGRPSVRPSVCLSVCLSYWPSVLSSAPSFAAAGLLLWTRLAWDIDRLLHGRRPAVSSTARSSKCGQCHVVRWRRKLNTVWFDSFSIELPNSFYGIHILATFHAGINMIKYQVHMTLLLYMHTICIFALKYVILNNYEIKFSKFNYAMNFTAYTNILATSLWLWL